MGFRRRSISPQAPDRNALALSLAAALAAATGLPAHATASGLPPTSLDAGLATAGAQTAQALYLDLVLDDRVVRPLVAVTLREGRASVAADDLVAIGLLLPPDLATDGSGQVALDAVAGLRYRYDAGMQQLALFPAPGQRMSAQLGYRAPGTVVIDRDQGLVLDWDAYGRSFDRQESLAVGTRARWFGRFGAVELSGVSRAGADGDAYSRLETRWSYSDPVRLWTWTAGDLVSGGLAWTRPVRLGGVQWRRDFGVRPDLIVYPMPQFAASATVPSSVELYVNNLRQFGMDVEPGPFVLTDFPRVVGAGEAVVVVTDALGRKTQTTVPLYVDYQRLARGLTDFSLELGVPRLGFGGAGDRYGHTPMASASWRRGLSDQLTLESHGEAGDGLRLGGLGLAWSPAGRYGVATASWAYSGGVGNGRQTAAGYQYYAQRAGLDLYTQRADTGYRDLGALELGGAVLRAQDRASLWVTIPQGGLSATWLRYRDSLDIASRSVSFGLTQTRGGVSLSANLFHDNRAGRGVSLSVSVPLGERDFASVNASRRGGDNDFVVGYRHSPPYRGGWGWEAQARDNGDGQLSVNRRGRAGDWLLGLDRIGGDTGAFAQGNGSLVMMGGQAFASRRISDAFAVVSTNGIADVPILYENRVAGRTNDAGYLLLPELRGWQRNRVAIDPDSLPADVALPAIERMVTPADRAGVRALFALQRLRSATVLLHDGAGQPVAAGTRVTRADGSVAIVGFDGGLWLEHYLDGETLRWQRAGVACSVVTAAMLDPSAPPPARPLTCNSKDTP